jgi:hypothetical protein
MKSAEAARPRKNCEIELRTMTRNLGVPLATYNSACCSWLTCLVGLYRPHLCTCQGRHVDTGCASEAVLVPHTIVRPPVSLVCLFHPQYVYARGHVNRCRHGLSWWALAAGQVYTSDLLHERVLCVALGMAQQAPGSRSSIPLDIA